MGGVWDTSTKIQTTYPGTHPMEIDGGVTWHHIWAPLQPPAEEESER